MDKPGVAPLVISRNHLEKIINAVADPIFVKDRQHRGVLVNDAFCNFIGHKREELQLLDKSDYDFFPKGEADRFWAADEAVFTTGMGIVNEETFTDAGGTAHTIITKKTLYTDESGEPFLVGIIRDITERKRIEDALRESQALYHSLVEQLPTGVFRKDKDGRYVFVNARYCRITGTQAEHILGKKPEELMVYQSDVEHLQSKWRARLANQGMSHHELILQTGRQIEVEEEYPGPAGEEQYFHVVKSPVFSPDGKINGSQGIMFDITGRKRAEIELAYERDLLRTLMDHSPDHIYFKDSQSRFIKSSSAQARQLGVASPEEVVGKTDFDFFTEAHARPAFEDEQEIIRTGRPMIGKVERESWKDGRGESWVLTSKMPFRNPAGEIIGLFGISKDITAIKQTEAALAYERDLLKSLLDNFPDSIYFKDLQSRFVRVSRSKLERNFASSLARHNLSPPGNGPGNLPAHLTGLEPFAGYLAGKTDFDFLAEKDARILYAEEQEIIRTGKPLIGKIDRVVHLDGKTGWYLSTKMPWRNKSGNVIGTFGTTKDITFIKEAEARLEQANQQLLETSRLAGMAEVATSVLHNIGNFLNSVNVSSALVSSLVKKSKAAGLDRAAALLREHAADLGAFLTSDPRGKELPDYLGQLAEHLAREQTTILAELDLLTQNVGHIKDIVAMQQNYARVSGVIETVEIADLVRDALRLNADALRRHGVTVACEFEDVPPMNVEKHKVLQILVNLVRNAKQACTELARADKRLTVQITGKEGRVRVTVADNGVGIPPENLTRIFSHGFTTRKDGHGFGLHSGALTAREMGGSLNVQSDGPGRGAAFTLELPGQPHEGPHE